MSPTIKQNYRQTDAFNDTSRFQYWLAGRRGGKTYAVVRSIRDKVHDSPEGAEIVYIGPTNQHAKELIWEPLIEVFDEADWDYKAYISKQRFELPGKRKVYVLGAEKIQRIRGHALYHAFLDELAYFQVDLGALWRALRPTLADLSGGATLTTTPDGKGTQAYDLWIEAQSKPEWSTHFWRTLDNPWIPPTEVEEARKNLDEKSFRQEFEAAWMSFEGLAYYAFDENLNIKKQPDINPELPLKLCFDFNVNPTTLLVAQRDGKMNRYLKEYSLTNSSTEETVLQFCTDHEHLTGELRHDLRIRGDSSGNNRNSATGWSDYKYVSDILTNKGFRFSYDVPRSNPAIVDRVKHTNSWLRAFDGSHRIEIDPGCRDLIRDLASQPLKGRHPDPKNNLGHKADALGYDIYWEEIHTKHRTQSSIIL